MTSLRPFYLKAVLIFFAPLYSLSFFGQNLKYTASSQILASKSSNGMFSEFIGDDGHFVYILTNQGQIQSKKNKIVILEKENMTQVGEHELISTEVSKLLHCFAYDQSIYIFRREKISNGYEITGEILDNKFKAITPKKTLRHVNSSIDLESVAVNHTEDDKPVFVAVNTTTNSKSQNVQLEIEYFDKALISTFHNKFELKASYDLPDVANEKITHTEKLLADGTVIVDLAIRGFSQKPGNMNTRSNSYQYAYNFGEKELVEIPHVEFASSAGEYWYSDVVSDGTSTYLAGIYFEDKKLAQNDKKANASGIFLCPLSSEIRASQIIHLKFSADYIAQLTSQNAEGNNSEKASLTILSSDNPFRAIRIQYFQKDQSGITLVFACAGGFLSSNFLGNIGVVKSNTAGEIMWTSKINRTPVTYASEAQCEITTLVKNNFMYFIFQNEIENAVKEKRKETFWREGFIMDYVTLDNTNGAIAHHEISIPLKGFFLSDIVNYRNIQISQCNNQVYIQSFEPIDKRKKQGYYLHVLPE